jgi:putative sterol carrier protein
MAGTRSATVPCTNPLTGAVTLSLSDEDFAQMAAGKANSQKLFMTGKLKIKGDMMKASKLTPILGKAKEAKAHL